MLKAQSAELAHKSEAGGVIVGLKDADELADGWARLENNIRRHRPGLVLEGVLVEAMGRPGAELIVGGRSDPDWGSVIVAALGGVQAEMLDDVCLLTPDMSAADIRAELEALRCGALLSGFRGAPALDVDAGVQLIRALARFLEACPNVREVDLNPVVVHSIGRGVLALGALILAQ